MKGLWWQSTQPGAQELDTYQESLNSSLDTTQTSTMALFGQQLVTAFLIAGTVLVMYVLYQWSTMLLLVVIGVVTCIVTFRLLLDSKQSQPTEHIALAQEPLVAQTQDVSAAPIAENEPATPLFVFPDTPMPSSSLVRVLETIDLSSSDIEHFIKTSEHPVLPKGQEASRTKAYKISE
jgi:hypothetical protein